MANNCINCGNKASSDGFEIVSGQYLCGKCARPIRSDLSSLRYAKTYEEFAVLKREILNHKSEFNLTTNNIVFEQIAKKENALAISVPEQKEKYDELQREKEQKQIEQQKREREEKNELFQERRRMLQSNDIDGYWEYKAISLLDQGGLFSADSGRVNTVKMTSLLNDMGLDGWHLVTAYSNELGKNAFSGGMGGTMLGVNSTVDENVLIFERWIKL